MRVRIVLGIVSLPCLLLSSATGQELTEKDAVGLLDRKSVV